MLLHNLTPLTVPCKLSSEYESRHITPVDDWGLRHDGTRYPKVGMLRRWGAWSLEDEEEEKGQGCFQARPRPSHTDNGGEKVGDRYATGALSALEMVLPSPPSLHPRDPALVYAWFTTANLRRAKHRLILMAVPRADLGNFLSSYSLRDSSYAREPRKAAAIAGELHLQEPVRTQRFAIQSLPAA